MLPNTYPELLLILTCTNNASIIFMVLNLNIVLNQISGNMISNHGYSNNWFHIEVQTYPGLGLCQELNLFSFLHHVQHYIGCIVMCR